MDHGPPPPPPPHGENPRTTAGTHPKYEIFMIPEHSAGAGFLYLPSLKPNINSFVAGFASALMCVVVIQSLRPAIQQWWNEFQGMGNMGMMMLVVAVGLGAWAFGRQQADSTKGDANSGSDHARRRGPFTSTGTGSFGGGGPGTYSSSSPPPPPPRSSGPPPHQHAPPPHTGPPPNQHAPPPQQQQAPPRPPEPEPSRPAPQSGTPRAETPKNAWEKAREETRKREEERKAREADQKRREDAARRLRELREKEAREREQREKDRKEREQREKDAREREAQEKERLLNETRLREQREKELRDRLERERQLREKVEREAKEAKEKLERERKEREAAKEKEPETKARTGSTYAYSSVGERTSMWPNGRPPAPSSQPATPATPRAPPSATSTSASPTKKPSAPTAAAAAAKPAAAGSTADDEYSYRPYDKPKRPAHKKSVSDFSETSWAPSQSTARTTPPPSMRGPYTTKDPDKIVIRAVYCFLNQFAKTPASQLISGLGTVTDGLILRITTEGLFIDDDVRGVPQREWDVKAWTLKLVEVWCPTHSLSASSTSASASTPASHPFFKTMPARRADKGAPKTLVGDEADAFLVEMLGACKGGCRVGGCPFTNAAAAAARSSATSSSVSGHSNSSSHHKTGDWKAKGLHLLRATVRDQEGKRYLFVLSEEESWKVAVGLQRLRRGTQVRALGVSSMGQLEVKTMLETLGW